MTADEEQGPDFGPSGYLPDRAARRARKIVLRAPLGLQWVVGAVVAGLAIVIVGVVFLAGSDDPPGPPFTRVGPVDAVGEARIDHERGVLYVGGGGRVRAFLLPDGAAPVYCAASGRLESADGRVWNLTGRALDGGASLDEHPTLVHDGTLFVDLTRRSDGPAPQDTEPSPACT